MNKKSKIAAAPLAPKVELKLDPLRLGGTEKAANLEDLQAELLARRVAQAKNEPQKELYVEAAREAFALAKMTDYPALVFPALFEEKSRDQARLGARTAESRSSFYELVEV